MTTKLTLSVDPQVVAAAKRYAADAGTSVSHLVEQYLAALVAVPATPSDTPVLARVRGTMRGVELADYRRHLEEKYR